MLTKNISRFCLAVFLFITSAVTILAQPSNPSPDPTTKNLKTITLKDGTKIKGKLIGVQDNVYSNSSPPLKGQVDNLKPQMMADPEFVSNIQELVQDPKFVEILKDPDFVNAIMSYDPEKIKNNPKAQMLFQDPKVQEIMQRMREKHLQH